MLIYAGFAPAVSADDDDLRTAIARILDAESRWPIDTHRTAGLIASHIASREADLRAQIATYGMERR